MKSVGPNEAPKSKPQVSAPVSVRSRKMLKRTSGSRVRASSERKATSSSAARTSKPIVWRDPQPAALACERA